MRKSLLDLTKQIKDHLERDEEISELVDKIIPVEIMAVGYKMMNIDISIDQAWTLLTGYDEPVLQGHVPKDILMRIRMLMSSFSGETTWNSLLSAYKSVPRHQQLIEIGEDDRISLNIPRYDPSRKEKYEKILLNPIPYRRSDKTFAKAGRFTYKKIVDQSSVDFSGTIPKSLVRDVALLKEYRSKKEINFSVDFNWLNIAQEMDRVLGNSTNEWVERLKPIQLQSINRKENKFHYRGLQHIAGGLASGKSTFRTVNTYWLVKHQRAKVGIIEESVSDVLKEVQRLKELGIHAVPIIGKSNRKRHLNNYLQSKIMTTIDQLEDEPLKHLSGVCTLKALSQDFEEGEHEYYPCENVISGGKTPKLCPLIQQCGIFKDWSELIEADVWITTSAAVLSTRLPAMLDPFKRTIYEAMYDLLDVVFVDEADQVQKKFEEKFLDEYPAFGHSNSLVERIYRQFSEQIEGNYNLVDNEYISEWQMNLHHLKENIRKLLGKLKRSREIRNMLRHEVVYLNYLIHDIASELSENEKHYEVIQENMRGYSQNVTFRSVPTVVNNLQGLVRETKVNERLTIINSWIENVEGHIPKGNGKIASLYSKIELFVYLSNIEASLKYIKYYYPIIQQFGKIDTIPILSIAADFRPLMNEAMTGVMFGYRYDHRDGEFLGDFKVIQYMAIGRQLLYKWSNIYESADGRPGPAVILLSGTSYAPKSLHYHIEHEPNWFISSMRSKSKLTQTFLPLRNPKEHESIIHISGIRPIEKRYINLGIMVQELDRKMANELSFWKKRGERRRILLVVNSYDDVTIVGKALNKLDRWQGKYRLLSQDHKKDDVWYPRSMIEVFASEDANILVAPKLAISRGYNIMQGKTALFGTAFFLIRPYPVPNDLSYFVQMLHGQLPILLERVKNKNKQYAEAMRMIRKISRSKFEQMYSKPGYWSLLSEEERLILSWYTFIPTWQFIGRMLRGGSDARVFYCDGKFLNENSETPSLIDYWNKIMHETDDEIFNNLYGPFIESFGSIIN